MLILTINALYSPIKPFFWAPSSLVIFFLTPLKPGLRKDDIPHADKFNNFSLKYRVAYMMKFLLNKKRTWKIEGRRIKWYPSSKSCVQHDMSNVRPHQLPPLMVRKAAWRR